MRVISGSAIWTADDVGASGSVKKTASLNRGSDSAGTKAETSGVDDAEASLFCAASV
jgi:hypothetical protein